MILFANLSKRSQEQFQHKLYTDLKEAATHTVTYSRLLHNFLVKGLLLQLYFTLPIPPIIILFPYLLEENYTITEVLDLEGTTSGVTWSNLPAQAGFS